MTLTERNMSFKFKIIKTKLQIKTCEKILSPWLDLQSN